MFVMTLWTEGVAARILTLGLRINSATKQSNHELSSRTYVGDLGFLATVEMTRKRTFEMEL